MTRDEFIADLVRIRPSIIATRDMRALAELLADAIYDRPPVVEVPNIDVAPPLKPGDRVTHKHYSVPGTILGIDDEQTACVMFDDKVGGSGIRLENLTPLRELPPHDCLDMQRERDNLREQLETARALCDEIRKALYRAQRERDEARAAHDRLATKAGEILHQHNNLRSLCNELEQRAEKAEADLAALRAQYESEVADLKDLDGATGDEIE